MPAALETDSEMLQLYLQIEPLAGVAGAVCSLINKFFERDNNPTTASSPTLEWSPTNDDLPTELPSENIEKMGALAVHSWAFQGCVSPPRFKPAMLDAIYLCIVQNPLNLLLQLPANLIIRLLTSNVLARILLMLLMKLEAYAHMGPPTLPGRPPEPISAEEIIQLQVSTVTLSFATKAHAGLRLLATCAGSNSGSSYARNVRKLNHVLAAIAWVFLL